MPVFLGGTVVTQAMFWCKHSHQEHMDSSQDFLGLVATTIPKTWLQRIRQDVKHTRLKPPTQFCRMGCYISFWGTYSSAQTIPEVRGFQMVRSNCPMAVFLQLLWHSLRCPTTHNKLHPGFGNHPKDIILTATPNFASKTST